MMLTIHFFRTQSTDENSPLAFFDETASEDNDDEDENLTGTQTAISDPFLPNKQRYPSNTSKETDASTKGFIC